MAILTSVEMQRIKEGEPYGTFVGNPSEATGQAQLRLYNVPIPPSYNKQRGHRYTTPQFRAWRREFDKFCIKTRFYQDALSYLRGRAFGEGDAYCLPLEVLWARRMQTLKGKLLRRDIDNRLKALQDALAYALGVNDSVFSDVRLKSRHTRDGEFMFIRVGCAEAIKELNIELEMSI